MQCIMVVVLNMRGLSMRGCTIMSEKPKPKIRRIWQLEVKRSNSTMEGNYGVYIPVLRADRFVIEFQCDAGTYPFLSKCKEVTEKDEQPKEQNKL